MPTDPTVRLLLVDDHALFRDGLSRLLAAEQDFEVVGTFNSVETATAAMDDLQVDVVLLDFDLGQETGFELMEILRSRCFAGQVLIVTAGLTSADTLRVLELGAMGIFLKHRSPSDLILAIRSIVAGAPWLDSASMQTLVAAATSVPRQKSASTALNAKEKDVLSAVFEGLTNKEIGTKLGISEAYVKALMQQLFSKTGVRSRSQLVRVALERQALGRTPSGSSIVS